MNTIAFKKQSGFTLIEVMVALFVLTIGMLGSTSMMLRSQLKAQETNTETTAAQRVWNIAELIRSNVTGVNTGVFNNLEIKSTTPTVSGCITTGCDEGAMLEMITYLIQLELQAYLKDKGTSGSPVIVTISKYPPVPKADPDAPAEPPAEERDILFEIVLTWNELGRDGTYQKDYRMIFQP
ncbi:MAG TPA: prepilin-type N-terminal cleavage/methylation domain-containing protein [Gammaproteobacteria bacterium]|nr:prepilin-type N-terminal cleavage/methylation domain-containing protein [Gammaproteobacteria bacterium]